jgi:ubiquinone/menaquinone biosynthesis C-methylase UbiE
MARTLPPAQARSVYDRIGARQDTQAFYEDAAIEDLVANAAFDRARSVVEFGCGTGRLAKALLEEELPLAATYVGFDLSPVMVGLASDRLARFRERAAVRSTDGISSLAIGDASCDRFVSTYVFDLLSEERIAEMVAEAARVLEPEGRLCLVGLTVGFTPMTRWVERVWRRVHAFRPAWVGGCRPLELSQFLTESEWTIRHRRVLAPFAIPSEVLVASRN